MHDRQMQFSYMGALAVFAGVIAIGLAVACFFWDSRPLGFLGIHFAVASALFRIRSWLCVLSSRERDAFEMGRESALHRVR